MSEDRTTPMKAPQWSRQPDSDEQETVFTDQESVTPPTIPLGDPGPSQPPRPAPPPGPGQPAGPGFVRAKPVGGTTPPPYGPPVGPPAPQSPVAPADQTMIIRERPAPVFAWLVVVAGPDRNTIGKVHTLKPDTTTIGRGTGNHVVLVDDTCSGQHARIRAEAKEGEDSVYALFDMGSSNGTYVGTKETHKDEASRTYRAELQDGDYVLLGETTLVFKRI